MEASILEIVKAFTPAFLGIIGVIITLIFSVANKKLNNQKMEKELFTEFNKRYDELNDSLSLLTVTMTIEDLYKKPYIIKDKTLYNVVIDYFNLCSEQYYWKEKDRIPKEIWNAWHKGMMYYYNTYPVIQEMWKEETRGDKYKAYYLKEPIGFFKDK
ncbi:hypothetical protein [Sphingobacterium cellulitidis]|uniref:hypothetical protein n=1 Tax=Sphingobacterium cellulitidis TaxID=1768011 RepID=UPI003C7C5932